MANEAVAFQGWNASGVGWGNQPWGESLASLPTGTTAIGSVDVDASLDVSVTGLSVQALLNPATAEISVHINITGFQLQMDQNNALVWSVIDDSQDPNWQNVVSS